MGGGTEGVIWTTGEWPLNRLHSPSTLTPPIGLTPSPPMAGLQVSFILTLPFPSARGDGSSAELQAPPRRAPRPQQCECGVPRAKGTGKDQPQGKGRGLSRKEEKIQVAGFERGAWRLVKILRHEAALLDLPIREDWWVKLEVNRRRAIHLLACGSRHGRSCADLETCIFVRAAAARLSLQEPEGSQVRSHCFGAHSEGYPCREAAVACSKPGLPRPASFGRLQHVPGPGSGLFQARLALACGENWS